MKVDKGVSTWRIWGFYIQCLKELTFATSKRIVNNSPHTTIASSSPTQIYIYIYIYMNNTNISEIIQHYCVSKAYSPPLFIYD